MLTAGYWYLQKGISADVVAAQFPVSEQSLTYFIAYFHQTRYVAISILSTVSAISFVHKPQGIMDPG